MVELRKHNWLAAVLGVLLTGVPMFWLISWLQAQGEAEVSIMAERTVHLADSQIDRVAAVLNALAGKGIDACRPANLEVLRQTVFLSGPIKELALVAPGGQVLCADSGTQTGSRDVLASAATASPDIMLDVLRLNDANERLLRVRRLASGGKPQLAALLPAGLLIPRTADAAGAASAHVRMGLADGTLVGAVGDPPATETRENYVTGRRQSERYGLVFNVTMGREGVIATYDDLRRISMVISGILAIVILSLALVVPYRQRHNPISEIERALIANEFVPYYQPIVDIKSGKLLGAEVLVRWRKPDGTIVAPGAFIPLVESSGLIIDLTRLLMRQVRDGIGKTLGLRPGMYITFNIAPRHFDDAVVLNDVGSIFEDSPIALSQLVLELTERNEIENLTACRRVIAALQGLGCRIAIDDVGTGHSGLSYILKLGVDIIKIDKMFVDAIRTEKHSQTIIATMVDLARNLRMQIVAEGVENFEQVIYLRDNGIAAAQGYVFSPPLPESAFLQLIDAIAPVAEEPDQWALLRQERTALAELAS